MKVLRLTWARFVRPGAFAVGPVRGTATFYNHPPYVARPVSLDNQSVVLPGPEQIRSSRLLEDPYKLETGIPGAPEVKTVFQCLQLGHRISNDGDCIGWRPEGSKKYVWKKYSEVIASTKHVGSALIEIGLEPSKGTFVGVFASNCPEFFYTMYACAGYSMVMVPLYQTLGLQSVLFIINQTNLSLAIVHSAEYTMKIVENSKEVPSLKTIVLEHGITPDLVKAASEKNIKLISFSEFEAFGAKHPKEVIIPKPDDLFVIPYTSGTTGTPKGVMLTHKNVITCVSSLKIGYGEAGVFGGTMMSYLPPGHIYEIVNLISSMCFARRMAFYSGDIKQLMDEVRLVQPTILPLVPRIMNAIYVKTMEQLKDKPVKLFLLKMALAQKEKSLKRGQILKTTIWDKLFFKKFKAIFGENITHIVTTSAPVPYEIMRFYRIAAGTYLFEAYGQTEVLASNMTLPLESTGGFVGPPLSCNFMKLVDVPAMGYLSKDNVGEVCVKGPNVFQGYYKNPEATKETLIDGWQHTGDIGRWLPNGTLQIIDRKKHLFKLSQGEYIAPEKVENVYINSNLILQVFVDGISEKDFVVAVVVPEIENLKKWLVAKGYKETGDLETLLKRKDLRKSFLEELHKIGRKEDLNSFEQAKNLIFSLEPFTIANDLMTPTMKIRRNHARKVFEHLFVELYEEGNLIG